MAARRALAVGVVVLHHLSASILLPALIYPVAAGGDLIWNIARTLMHGGIVVMETVVLCMAILSRRQLAAASEERRLAAEQSNEDARKAHQKAECERTEISAVIEALKGRFELLAKGDLNCELSDDFGSNYNALRSDFNCAIDALREALIASQTRSTEFDADSQDLASRSEQVAERAKSTSARLSEASGQLAGLKSSLNETAQSACQARASSDLVYQDTLKNGDLVGQAVTAMSEIESSSGEIAKIVGMIEDIAFQTNLLALNASVEAARAGDRGLGFAVVASEVRALSQRTSEAASNVTGLIRKSVDQVTAGASLISASGEGLTMAVENMTTTNDLIQRISDASNEQASILSDLVDLVRSLDEVSQTEAGFMKDMTALSGRMADGARILNSSLAQFDLNAGARGASLDDWIEDERQSA